MYVVRSLCSSTYRPLHDATYCMAYVIKTFYLYVWISGFTGMQFTLRVYIACNIAVGRWFSYMCSSYVLYMRLFGNKNIYRTHWKPVDTAIFRLPDNLGYTICICVYSVRKCVCKFVLFSGNFMLPFLVINDVGCHGRFLFAHFCYATILAPFLAFFLIFSPIRSFSLSIRISIFCFHKLSKCKTTMDTTKPA